MTHKSTLSTLALAFGLAVTGGAALAQDCPRGDLDERYCDADGDLIADIPADESEQIDPDTLIFAYTPVEDPAVYKTAWADFLDLPAKRRPARTRQFFPVQSNAAQIEAMRSGRLHIAGFNTGSNPLAVNCAGFRPVHHHGVEDGSFGYEMEIITYPGSGIEKVEDIKGKQLAFTSPTSNSGFKAPSAILKADYDMDRRSRFRAGLLGQARQLDPRRREQGLSGGIDRQLGHAADDRARRRSSEDRSSRSTSRRPSRRPASAWSTTSSPSCRRRSRTPSSASTGKARRCRRSSRSPARRSSSR